KDKRLRSPEQCGAPEGPRSRTVARRMFYACRLRFDTASAADGVSLSRVRLAPADLVNGALASRVGAMIVFRSLDRRQTRRPPLKSATDRRSLRGQNSYALPEGPTRSSLHAVKLLLLF